MIIVPFKNQSSIATFFHGIIFTGVDIMKLLLNGVHINTESGYTEFKDILKVL